MKKCIGPTLRSLTVGGILFALFASSGYALINPRFTPIHLTEQSEFIAEVALKPGPAKDSCVAVVKKTLKGDWKRNELTLDFTDAANRQHAEALMNLVVATKSQGALFFAGEYLEKGRQVYIEGRIQTRSWEDQNGQKRYMTEISCNDLQLLSSTRSGGEEQQTENSSQAAPPPIPEEKQDDNQEQSPDTNQQEDDLPL